MRRTLITLIAAVMLSGPSIQAQDSTATSRPAPVSEESRIFEALLKTAADIQHRPTSRLRDPSIHLLAGEIRTAVSYLQQQWEGAGQPDLPDAYVLTLRIDLQALQSAVDDSVLAPADLLEHIRDDLALKVAYSGADQGNPAEGVTTGVSGTGSSASGRRALGFLRTYPTTVLVHVVTIQDGREVTGYLVRTNPTLYGVTQSPIFPFSSASSPTERELPPGDYTMWIQTRNGAFVGALPVTVGATGQKRQNIRVVIPK
jgi:hypothetical protein